MRDWEQTWEQEKLAKQKQRRKKMKKGITLSILGVLVIMLLICSSQILETVKRGTYHVKQAAITGTLTVKGMDKPGLYFQNFGDRVIWDKASTFFFTKDVKEGKGEDQSISVRFVDGSKCDMSGTMRVVMPKSGDQALALIQVHGFQTYADLEAKLLMPVTRKALIIAANMMTARESYAEKKLNFIAWTEDQILNGIYETESYTKIIENPLTGEKTQVTAKRIMRDADGNILRQSTPLDGLGLTIQNFEIKSFGYSPRVLKQIDDQQKAFMAVATAKAKAQEAIQDRRTAEEKGKANVMTARYQKEEEKIKAVVDAQKDKEVTVIAAEKRKAEAKLDKDAAEFTKQKEILLGEGEAKRKALNLAADGALRPKLDTYEEINRIWAEAFKERKVPTIIMGGGRDGQTTGTDADVQMMLRIIQLQALKQMGLDMTVPTGKTVK